MCEACEVTELCCEGSCACAGIVLAAFIIGVLISFSRVCCTPRPARGSAAVVPGTSQGHTLD